MKHTIVIKEHQEKELLGDIYCQVEYLQFDELDLVDRAFLQSLDTKGPITRVTLCSETAMESGRSAMHDITIGVTVKHPEDNESMLIGLDHAFSRACMVGEANVSKTLTGKVVWRIWKNTKEIFGYNSFINAHLLPTKESLMMVEATMNAMAEDLANKKREHARN